MPADSRAGNPRYRASAARRPCRRAGRAAAAGALALALAAGCAADAGNTVETAGTPGQGAAAFDAALPQPARARAPAAAPAPTPAPTPAPGTAPEAGAAAGAAPGPAAAAGPGSETAPAPASGAGAAAGEASGGSGFDGDGGGELSALEVYLAERRAWSVPGAASEGGREVPEEWFVPSKYGVVPSRLDYFALPALEELYVTEGWVATNHAHFYLEEFLIEDGVISGPAGPVVTAEDIWWGDYDPARAPGSGPGPAGPVGHTGEAAPAYSAVPGPADEDFALWFDDRGAARGGGRVSLRKLREHQHWQQRASTDAYDVCDDAVALALAYGGRALGPGEELTSRDRARIKGLRRDALAECYGSPLDRKYVAVGPFYSSYAPSKAHTTPQAALAEVIDRTPPSARGWHRECPDEIAGDSRRLAGVVNQSRRSVGFARELPLEDNDAVVVSDQGFTVENGVLRGLLHNQSRNLFARNVEVTASSTGPDGRPAAGTWQWPLTMQPGEFAPIEIDNWTGSAQRQHIRLDVSYSLSEHIDLTRSFRGTAYTPDRPAWHMPEALLDHMYPASEPQKRWGGWAIQAGWSFEQPQSHPSLEPVFREFHSAGYDQTLASLPSPDHAVPPDKGVGPFKLANVGQFNLKSYIAFLDYLEGPPPQYQYRHPDSTTVTLDYAGAGMCHDRITRIIDIVDLSPYLYPTFTDGPAYLDIPLLSTNYIIWIGGANPPNPDQ